MSVSHIPIGTLVRVHTDIPKADRDSGKPGFNDYMDECLGGVGIVCEEGTFGDKVFFNNKQPQVWTWRRDWLTVLGKKDEDVMDAAWLRSLREAYGKAYPDVELTQATKRIKKTIAELRDTLAALDKEVDALKK